MKLVSINDVRKFKSGDEYAFEKIFNAYKNIVFHECLIRLKNRQDAEDCFQEIFIKLVNNIAMYDETISSFDAWFTTVYKNHIINFYKSRIIRSKYSDTIDYEEIIRYEDNLHKDIELMVELITILGEETYTIVVYRIKYQFTYRKISEIMNMSLDMVRRKYIEAMEILKEHFK